MDAEVANIKCGISLEWSGTRGTDYAEEYFYFDKTLCDHRVIYIKDTTSITMLHNSLNIAGKESGEDSYESVDTSVGTIMYKPDGDMRFAKKPGTWSEYTAPLTFATMNYGAFGDSGTSVVGTVGANETTIDQDSKTTRYCQGMLDSVGDEWHTITVADDDSDRAGSVEYQASDGKVFLFVVNPKTPCLTLRVTGDGQFYTTPAKKYFFPRIYDQETYFSVGTGGVTVEIEDINGNNVFYRVVTDTASGDAYTDAGASTVTLDETDFADGEQYLQYYYAGNAAYTKTRKITKNPAFPSAGEDHGDKLWVDSSYWGQMLTSAGADYWMNQWRTNTSFNRHTSVRDNRGTGKRTITGTQGYKSFIENALIAKKRGMDYESVHSGMSGATYADVCKWMLLELHTVLDPVGVELNTSNNPIPTRELLYRGYYDVRPIYSAAAAYDIIAGDYRSDQYSGGMTPIEDYYIRDLLARWVHLCGLNSSGYTEFDNFDTGGMWNTARKTGAAFIACMMPSYSTEYFGTSGMDGSDTVYTGELFSTTNHTWRALYIDNSVEPIGYPDVSNRLGVNEYLFDSDGVWQDRVNYTSTALCGQCLGIYYNLLKLFRPSKTLPNFDVAMEKAADGELTGSVFVNSSDRDPRFRSWTVMCNSWHPDFRDVAYPKAQSVSSSNSEFTGKQANTGGPFYVLWVNQTLPLGSDPDIDEPPPASAPVNKRRRGVNRPFIGIYA